MKSEVLQYKKSANFFFKFYLVLHIFKSLKINTVFNIYWPSIDPMQMESLINKKQRRISILNPEWLYNGFSRSPALSNLFYGEDKSF